MTNDKSPHLLNRISKVEVLLALVTLTFGALTTSKNAGMAFADWPTSDGYLMVTYPWLRDFSVNWDKFLEHGHRLAGMVIGMWSILLVVMAFRLESRVWVKRLAVGILLGVICQGLLGGFRVQLNDRGLAMLHGIFAAIVFSLMGTMVAVTSPQWRNAGEWRTIRSLTTVKRLSVAIVILVLMQYILGSLVRHQGTSLHEHLGLGLLVMLVIAANAVAAARLGPGWLRRSAFTLLGITVLQVAFGLLTWVVKFGLPAVGYVAIADSTQQLLVRTVHMVWGTVTLLAAVVNMLKVYRVAAVSAVAVRADADVPSPASTLIASGGRP
ncbi:COX15/CtaA family protein [Planctomicrobium piriforme]|uniref:Cytochrome c oxidase assembly protein subunit 15 n=1 Tax=Planctomicrobium piriforme TaxID=1576369 RepID=A0A1I3CYI2_9PLAN|nr:COX15/CtaA family protein [Planctomicrobium piriforme]SFH79545.1 cytochrome c oxidase assembly protein subunit 15 [Planctomicrobium piriforme]